MKLCTNATDPAASGRARPTQVDAPPSTSMAPAVAPEHEVRGFRDLADDVVVRHELAAVHPAVLPVARTGPVGERARLQHDERAAIAGHTARRASVIHVTAPFLAPRPRDGLVRSNARVQRRKLPCTK